jgi:hypothetical protein
MKEEEQKNIFMNVTRTVFSKKIENNFSLEIENVKIF